MLHRMLAKAAESPRDTLMWTVLATLVVAQIIAFWMLCHQQVRKAEVRGATLQVQRAGLADCQQEGPRSTMRHCGSQGAERNAVMVNTAAGSTVRVSYSR